MTELPTGTVTFLFTDLEGSSGLWESHPEAMRAAVDRHDVILRDAVESHRGVVFSTTGDGIAAAFASGSDALAAVLSAQQRLGSEPWGATGPLRARMGLHSDEARLRAPDQYVNRPLNRCARLMAIAHGGQVLVSGATAAITRNALPDAAALLGLGEHRLRDLAEPVEVYQLVHAELQREFPPLRSLNALPGNLPRLASTFVGREREIEALSSLVRERALVTLTGVGGVGKTRLALQVAAEVVLEFSGGAWLCELAPVTDPGALWEVLATALGAPRPPGRSVEEAVLGSLAPKRLLLVLDNCEHLLDAAARVVSRIGQRCPEVVVLATSREGLALAGEQLVAVPSLVVPAEDDDLATLADAEAVHLFVERAHDAKRDFALDPHNARAVAQLCRRLDGIPLAIELAAARVRALTPRDLVERLDQRFRLLTRGSRAALERHQTLRSTIDWSYDLLSPRERSALNRLSVFAGGCELRAAEAIVGGDDLDSADVADALGQLVDKSLVIVDEAPVGVRYRLLETIRQYAQERLEAQGDAPAFRQRHALWYIEAAQELGKRLRSADQIAAGRALAREIDNFRAALDWAVELADADPALRLVAPLCVYGGTSQLAMVRAEAASAIPGAEQHPLFPSVTVWAAFGAVMRGDYERADALVGRAQAGERAFGKPSAGLCMAQGALAMFRGDFETARGHADAWVRLARVSADPYELAHALVLQASTMSAARHDAARQTMEEAVLVARNGGIASALLLALSLLAGWLEDDEQERAVALLAEAEEIATQLGHRLGIELEIISRGWIALRRAEWRVALDISVRHVDQRLRYGDLPLLRPSYAQAWIALVGLGRFEPAAVLLGRTEVGGGFMDAGYRTLAEKPKADLLASLGAERVEVLRRAGAAMSHTEAVAFLRAEASAVLGQK